MINTNNCSISNIHAERAGNPIEVPHEDIPLNSPVSSEPHPENLTETGTPIQDIEVSTFVPLISYFSENSNSSHASDPDNTMEPRAYQLPPRSTRGIPPKDIAQIMNHRNPNILSETMIRASLKLPNLSIHLSTP